MQICHYFLALERSSKNIWLKLSAGSGSFELYDDGDSVDLKELKENSLLINRSSID